MHDFLPHIFALETAVEIVPRLGQGIFRVVIIDAYGRRCAVTGEKACPPPVLAEHPCSVLFHEQG